MNRQSQSPSFSAERLHGARRWVVVACLGTIAAVGASACSSSSTSNLSASADPASSAAAQSGASAETIQQAKLTAKAIRDRVGQ